MTKEELINLGLSTELADKVLERFKTETLGLIPKEELEVSEQAKNALEKQVKEYAKNIETLKKSVGDTDALNEKINQLQEQNKKATADYEKSIKDMQINYAIDNALKAAKAKNSKAVKPFLNLDDISVEDGKVKGLDKQIKKLVEGEDTKFLFSTPPQPTAGKPNAGIQSGDITNNNDTSQQGTSAKTGLSIGARMAQVYNKLMNPSTSSDNK